MLYVLHIVIALTQLSSQRLRRLCLRLRGGQRTPFVDLDGSAPSAS